MSAIPTNDEITTELAKDMGSLHVHLTLYKPNDRSDLDRRFAVAMTEFEKLRAYIVMYIINPLDKNE